MSSDEEEMDWSDSMHDSESETEERDVRFRVVNVATIAKLLHELVADLSQELGVGHAMAQQLLYKFKFNLDRCKSAYFDDPSTLGMPDFDEIFWCAAKLDECIVCCAEDEEGVDVGCGHAVCKDCFTQYVEMQIEERNVSIKCPGNEKCGLVLTDDIVANTVNDFTYRAYLKAKVDLWLSNSKGKRFSGCPTPDCKYFVEMLEPIYVEDPKTLGVSLQDAVVECGCRASFCFLCGQSHLPVSCGLVEAWMRISNDASNVWIRENTKPCPRCATNIQKNAGCNHMHCRCGYHFCWECMGIFHNYEHRCATYDANNETNATSKSAIAAKRLLFYAPRVINNQGRVKFHFRHLVDLLDKYRSPGEDPLDEFMSIQVDDHRIEVHTALAHGRSMLAWTLVLLFYIKANNERQILEDCVLQLQDASEKLCVDITAKVVTISKEEQLKRAAYVRTRTKTLRDFVLGHKWQFENYAKSDDSSFLGEAGTPTGAARGAAAGGARS